MRLAVTILLAVFAIAACTSAAATSHDQEISWEDRWEVARSPWAPTSLQAKPPTPYRSQLIGLSIQCAPGRVSQVSVIFRAVQDDQSIIAVKTALRDTGEEGVWEDIPWTRHAVLGEGNLAGLTLQLPFSAEFIERMSEAEELAVVLEMRVFQRQGTEVIGTRGQLVAAAFDIRGLQDALESEELKWDCLTPQGSR